MWWIECLKSQRDARRGNASFDKKCHWKKNGKKGGKMNLGQSRWRAKARRARARQGEGNIDLFAFGFWHKQEIVTDGSSKGNYELDSSHDLTRLVRAFCSSAMPRVDSAISRASRVRTSAQRIPYTLPFAPLVSREHTYYLANMRACVGRAYSWRASGRPQLSEQIMLLSKCQVSLFCSTFRKLSSHLDENEITRRAMSMLRHPWFPWQIAHHHPSRLIDVEEGLREPYHSKLFHFQF